MSEFDSFTKYFEKAFSGMKPIVAWILAAIGRTLLAVRAVAEMAGYEVGWDGQTRRINLRK